MSDNVHLREIREILDTAPQHTVDGGRHRRISRLALDAIREHAEALKAALDDEKREKLAWMGRDATCAAALEEERTRAERCQEAVLRYRGLFMIAASLNGSDTSRYVRIAERDLQDGDLPAAPTGQEDESCPCGDEERCQHDDCRGIVAGFDMTGQEAE